MKLQLQYPIELMKVFAQSFNLTIKEKLIRVESNELYIVFKTSQLRKQKILYNLVEKLAQAMSSIDKKYMETKYDTMNRVDVQINLEEFIIKINAVRLIPTQKLVQLFDLILWYYITSKTGDRPKNTQFGMELTSNWQNEKRRIHNRFYRFPTRTEITQDHFYCHFCGKKTRMLNIYEITLGAGTVEYRSPVCPKHRKNDLF